jgi:aldose 1-epimerase
MKIVVLLLALSMASTAQNYTAQRTSDHGVAIIRLTDAANGVDVSIVPSIGNRAYEMNVHGKNILYFPSADVGEFQKRPELSGIPFLAPWANRLNEQGFWANGKKYTFNMILGNVRGSLPIHGMLSSSPLWEVMEVAADRQSAHVTSRLQFWRNPDLMAQWPFAHEYEMTYRLADGVLEVRVTVTNLSSNPMPVVLGFHPYYRIPGIPRDNWIATLPARKIVVADDRLIPTGELKPFDLPNPLPLKGRTLDTGFTDLDRDAAGRAHFSIESGGMKVETLFGAKYPVAVVWEPPAPEGQTRDFICIEPMTGITSAVNLQHEGKYAALQTVAPGAKWSESFWVRSSGI